MASTGEKQEEVLLSADPNDLVQHDVAMMDRSSILLA